MLRRLETYICVEELTLIGQQTSIISAFLIGMAMNPAAQKKAQEELDIVVGPHRLPTMDDIAGLPYIQAVLMECFRYMPVLPLNLPHDAVEDDEYEGYFIPRGCAIIVVCLLHTRMGALNLTMYSS